MIDIQNRRPKTEPRDTNPAPANESHLPPLRLNQRRAIELLAAGSPIVDAAMAADVHRNTVQRWLRDPVFAAHLRVYDCGLRERARVRMFALAERAGTCIEHAIMRGDSRLALQLLRSMDTFRFEEPRLAPFAAKGANDAEQESPRSGPADEFRNLAQVSDHLENAARYSTQRNRSTADESARRNRYFSFEHGNLAPEGTFDDPTDSAPWGIREPLFRPREEDQTTPTQSPAEQRPAEQRQEQDSPEAEIPDDDRDPPSGGTPVVEQPVWDVAGAFADALAADPSLDASHDPSHDPSHDDLEGGPASDAASGSETRFSSQPTFFSWLSCCILNILCVQQYATIRNIAGVYRRFRPFAALVRLGTLLFAKISISSFNSSPNSTLPRRSNPLASFSHRWSVETSRRLAFFVAKTYDAMSTMIAKLSVVRIITAYAVRLSSLLLVPGGGTINAIVTTV